MAANANGPAEARERLFVRKGSAESQFVWCLVGGTVGVGVSVIGFFVAIFGQVDQFSLQFMTTLPMLLGIGAFYTAWSIANTPHKVAVGPRGVRIRGKRIKKDFLWEEIGWAATGTTPMTHRPHLVLYDADGKSIARFDKSFDDFDELVDLLLDRFEGRSDDTSDSIRTRKSKRSAMLLLGMSPVLLAACVFAAWDTHRTQREIRLLEETAIEGEAEIVDRFLAPNGVTPRLEYRVKTPDGLAATRNAQVTRAYWNSLEEATTVPVRYVPGEPDISRLVQGEDEKGNGSPTDSPLVGYGLSVLMAIFSLVVLGAGILQWKGLDIDFDSKTRQFSIKKFGTGR